MNYAAWALSAVSYVENYPDSLADMSKRADWNLWTLTELPEGRKPITCKWVFKIKKAVANQERLKVHQLDVKTAFLNGTLQEEIYMAPPEGLVNGSKHVCRLNRALYGLKQASRAWNERFHQFVIRLKFKRSENDQCLYVRTENDERLILVLYVDDILIVGSDLRSITVIKSCFKKEFAMSDMGEISCFLGMRIERNIEKWFMRISQRGYCA